MTKTFSYDAFGNRWRYAAKEEQRFGPADLGLLDSGARMYDPFTARWTAVDPMAAKYPGHSPFNYCEGNPLLFYDPVGQTIYFFHWVSDENKTILRKSLDSHQSDEKEDHSYYLNNLRQSRFSLFVNQMKKVFSDSSVNKAKIKHDNRLKKQ